jgi:hypothetical protein
MSYTPSPVVYNGDIYVFRTGQGDRAEIWFNRTTGGSGYGSNSWAYPIALYNNVPFSKETVPIGFIPYAPEPYYTTGNFNLVIYNNASGTPTLAVYFVGYNTTDLYYMETTDPSSWQNWSTPVQAGVPLPQGVTPPGLVEEAASWAVACISGEPADWWDSE